ncbi:holo-ACP synthase [Alicyclobacillus mengziensis]|uniref:Holo-[acyl-carrier-protein] synthase n=1 Tax=Alicyclobacillus mengziensis TaxID=2931921 RepID=A0A9X7VY64_9BACL|nr:holo-ACP synthase [Alicyclobacillus mengziensis]QSO47002.1 holo-ACP synthase [Alicyclobacillus mengziensis]
MILGLGSDVIEIPRIAKACQRYGDGFLARVLSPSEAEFASLLHETRRFEFVAGRFAAKEAMAKASGVGLARLGMTSVELKTTEQGLVVHFMNADHVLTRQGLIWHVSISHSTEMAFAVAVVEQL